MYADDLKENLPRPGRSWEWVECDLDPSLQQRLASHDLIVKDGETERWRTTERFWSYVIYRLGVSEDALGTALGQEQLFASGTDVTNSQSHARVDTDLQPAHTGEAVQVTLTGDAATVDDDEMELVERHAAKGPSDDEDPAKGTLPLGMYTTSEWDGPTLSKRSLARPTGTVY
ncbi:hypothetical protein [Halomicrobium urmianum]|uniref:hypothetical protein n=1 Tax=Halomicrobium urmianum TaxID=1586233 RepID=UPI001CD999E1|nr:hypothetical protein [Halomicrobium urmianum]